MKEEKRLIEAALFMSSRAMSLEEFRTLTGIGALGYLQGILAELKKDYEERGSAVEISKSALRTLAYLSKHDGMLKSELVRRVGTQAYQDVKELVSNGFLKTHKAGRSSKLTLTEKFRRYFVQEGPRQEAPPENQTVL